jgi:hypothetical protein
MKMKQKIEIACYTVSLSKHSMNDRNTNSIRFKNSLQFSLISGIEKVTQIWNGFNSERFSGCFENVFGKLNFLFTNFLKFFTIICQINCAVDLINRIFDSLFNQTGKLMISNNI